MTNRLGGRRRVAVSGIGVVSACGRSVRDLWGALVAGPDGPPAEGLDWFTPTDWLSRSDARRSSSYIHYAVAAASLAMADAGDPPVEPARTGVLVGHTHGPSDRIEAEDRRSQTEGASTVAPFLTVLSVESAPAAAIAASLGARGPVRMPGGACASGAFAVGDGAQLVRSGRCDLVLAGGTAGVLAEVLHAAYRNIRVISPSGIVRPFDERRDGFVYRPGATVLVLEPLDAVVARGARPYAEILGSASTNDGGDPVHPSGVGARECVLEAVADAGLLPTDVAHVNAHGSATRANDLLEASLVADVFPQRPPVTSVKGVTGHSLGGAGALEAAAACLSLFHGVLTPAGLDLAVDPEIEATGIDVVSGAARSWRPGPIVSCSYGLGGQNGAVVFGPAPPQAGG